MSVTTYPTALSPIATLADLLVEQAIQRPDQTFVHFPDGGLSYAQVLSRARAMAKGLIALGVRPGDHVGILMPNHAHFVVAHFAVQLAGARGVLFNARFKQAELASLIPRSDTRVMITTDAIDAHVNFTRLLEASLPGLAEADKAAPLALPGAPVLQHFVRMGDSDHPAAWSEAGLADLGAGLDDSVLEAAVRDASPEEVAVMIFTSGTTALPKACMLSHGCLQRAWRVYLRYVRFQPGEKIWVPMPFFHSGGIGLLTAMSEIGGTLFSSPHYDAETILGLIRDHRIEHLYPGFHTLSVPLLTHPEYDREKFDFVRSMVNVGPLGTQERLQSLLPGHAPIMNLFGMSEASGLMFLALPDAPAALRLTGAGTPPPGVGLRLVDPETGEDVAVNTPGEIWFRGGGSFLGYYADPAATEATITPEGWVRSGDMGRIDEHGWLYYVDRYKDMIKVGGENVAAAEIEAFLSAHPAVKFVQVVAKPDEVMAEVPVAFVELAEGHSLTLSDIEDFCRDRIARFKIPRALHIVTEWPMSATKVQKFKLREALAEMSDA